LKVIIYGAARGKATKRVKKSRKWVEVAGQSVLPVEGRDDGESLDLVAPKVGLNRFKLAKTWFKTPNPSSTPADLKMPIQYSGRSAYLEPARRVIAVYLIICINPDCRVPNPPPQTTATPQSKLACGVKHQFHINSVQHTPYQLQL
jgi:hypothetical protein